MTYTDEWNSQKSLPDALRVSMKYRRPDVWLIRASYWLILLTVAAPWSALLVWRAKRRRLQPAPLPPAVPEN